jgi:hypothetical protein
MVTKVNFSLFSFRIINIGYIMKKRSFWLGNGDDKENDRILDQPEDKSHDTKESSSKPQEDTSEKGKVTESN